MIPCSTPMHHFDDHGKFCHPRPVEARGLVAVVATLSKGYDLEYIWKQVDRGPAKDAASYYIQASESGGEPPGRWWGPGAKAVALEPGQQVDREPYDLLFGERQAPDGTHLVVAQAYAAGEELLHRTQDGVVELRIVAVEPLSEVVVTLKFQAGDLPRPIEAGGAVVALQRVGQVEFGADRAIGDFGLRKVRGGQSGGSQRT